MRGTTATCQERHVNEHALRALRSRVRWDMIISTISYGKRQVDSGIVCTWGGSLRSRQLILTLPRCHALVTI